LKPDYRLLFGSDLSNYYPNRGLKVFEPKAAVLAKIINYRDPLTRTHCSRRRLRIIASFSS
ncbi:MAG TPA: hypothetical protein VF982_12165, partial [Anaerolineales bacterium]